MGSLSASWKTLLPALLAFLPLLHAQTQPVEMRAVVNGETVTVTNGGALSVSVPNQDTLGQTPVVFAYTGQSTATVIDVTIQGDPSLSVTGVPSLPAGLGPSQGLAFTLVYAPSSPAPVSAILRVRFRERVGAEQVFLAGIDASVGNGGGGGGVTSGLIFAYALADGNVFPLADGDTIRFPSTALNARSIATVFAVNQSAAVVQVASVSLDGTDFLLENLPLLPFSLPPNGQIAFRVVYSPNALGAGSGTLTLTGAGRRLTINLAGDTETFAYATVTPAGTVPILPGQTIAFPETQLGAESEIVLQVRNLSSQRKQVDNIALAGAQFGIREALLLPLVIPPQGVLNLTLFYRPASPLPARGQLRVDDDVFDLTGTTPGNRLSYSFTVGEATAAVRPGQTLLLSAVPVGGTSRAIFQIRNEGAAEVTILIIGLATAGTPFSLPALPPLPVRLAPGDAASFPVEFAPANTSAASATLLVDQVSFLLAGVGTAPPPLTGYRIEGLPATAQPLTQPQVGVRLDQPLAIELRGTLLLGVSSASFSDDPAIQFASGGRAADFRIPANSTQAVFLNGQTSIGFQTGTVAASIALLPTFRTLSGFDLTPPDAIPVTTAVPPAPPVLTGLQVVERTANGFVLVASGFSTSRSVSELTFQFTPANGATIAVPELRLDVHSSFLAWYRTPQAASFGSLFSIAVPILIRVDGGSANIPSDFIASVTAQLSNELGQSNQVTAALR